MNQTKLGTFYITLSAVMYGSYGVWSKLMTDTFGEFNQAWIRALLLLAILLPLGIVLKQFRNIDSRDWPWFILISIAGGANQAPYFYAFEHLGVGTATLLFYVALTLGAYIFGVLGFKEKLTTHKLIALVLGIAGLGIIYRFGITANQVFPALAALISGLMGSVFVVFSKKLSGNYSELQILSLDLIAVLAFNIPLGLLLAEPLPELTFSLGWLAQLGYAFSFLVANLAVIAGMKRLQPSIGGIIGLSEVVFGAVFGVLLFSEPVTLSLVVGGILILLSAGWNDGIQLFVKKKSPSL